MRFRTFFIAALIDCQMEYNGRIAAVYGRIAEGVIARFFEDLSVPNKTIGMRFRTFFISALINRQMEYSSRIAAVYGRVAEGVIARFGVGCSLPFY